MDFVCELYRYAINCISCILFDLVVYLQEKDGKVKISFRSKEDQAVNQLAADHFDGGGHAYASGGINFDTLEATISKLKSVIHSYIL